MIQCSAILNVTAGVMYDRTQVLTITHCDPMWYLDRPKCWVYAGEGVCELEEMTAVNMVFIIIILIIKNDCHSNIIVDRLQGCDQNKKLRESERESRSSKVV